MQEDVMTEKEQFERYERVRKSGIYNMLADADRAASLGGLSKDEYWHVLKNYRELSGKYAQEPK
jgi:hypothetical protein